VRRDLEASHHPRRPELGSRAVDRGWIRGDSLHFAAVLASNLNQDKKSGLSRSPHLEQRSTTAKSSPLCNLSCTCARHDPSLVRFVPLDPAAFGRGLRAVGLMIHRSPDRIRPTTVRQAHAYFRVERSTASRRLAIGSARMPDARLNAPELRAAVLHATRGSGAGDGMSPSRIRTSAV
jgi:hypothetical protein